MGITQFIHCGMALIELAGVATCENVVNTIILFFYNRKT